MGEVIGNKFIIWQGENPDLFFPVVNLAGSSVDLTGGKATLTYWKDGIAPVNVDGTIATTTVTVTLEHDDTSALEPGVYSFQLFCKNQAGKMVMSKVGKIEVRDSADPDAVYEEEPAP